jgi:hypothetical protein
MRMDRQEIGISLNLVGYCSVSSWEKHVSLELFHALPKDDLVTCRFVEVRYHHRGGV